MQINKVVNSLDTSKYNAIIKQFNDKHNKSQKELYDKCIALLSDIDSLITQYNDLLNKYVKLSKLVNDNLKEE